MTANLATKKQNLHDALVQAVDNVIDVLVPYVKKGKVPREPITEARRSPEGGYIYRHYHHRDYTGLAMRHSEEWKNLPSVQKAIQELLNDRDVQQDFNTVGFGNLHDYVTTQIVHQFIYRNLRLTLRWPPSTSTIEASFREFEDYLVNNTVYCEAMVPLDNFECESKRLVFERDIEIRELSEREKEKIVSRAISGSLENEMEAMRHKFAAIIKLSWVKGNLPFIDHRGKLNALLTALRLFKTGGVGANVVYRREPKWQPGHFVGGAGREIYSVPVVGPVYKLNTQEAKDFLIFWKWFHQPRSNNVEVAIRWFNHGFEDWISDDRVVSFVTAFESLFLRRHEENKRKKLANRIPRLLTDAANRTQLNKNVGDIWDLRNSIVHAELYQTVDAPGIAGTAELYLRESIKRYIELERGLISHTQAEILKWLDDPNVDINKQAMFSHWKTI